jgi:hypothetical protein
MAEAMAAAITVRFTPLNSSSSSVLFAPVFSPVSFTPPQASGNDAAIFQVLHTAPPQPATIAAQRVQVAARNPKPVCFWQVPETLHASVLEKMHAPPKVSAFDFHY